MKRLSTTRLLVLCGLVLALALGVGVASAGWRGLSNLKYFAYDDPGHVCTDGIQFGLADIARVTESVEVQVGFRDANNNSFPPGSLLQNTNLGPLGDLDPPVDAGGEPNPFGSFYTLAWETPAPVGAAISLNFTGTRIASTTDEIEDCTLLWPFDGFFQPVDNSPIQNEMKAGRAVPVKFSLGGDRGLEIFAAGYPKVVTTACATGAASDGVEETTPADTSKLSYDAATDQYNYVWKTDKSWAGTCRKLVLKLADGSPTEHTLLFTFR